LLNTEHDVEKTFEEVREQVSRNVKPINSLELDSFANQYLIESLPDTLDTPIDELDRLKKTVKTSDLISKLEESLEEKKKTIKEIKQGLTDRLKNVYINASERNCFNWCSKDIHLYDKSVYTRYTRQALEDLEKHSRSNDMLKDIVYPDFVDSSYFKAEEEKRSTRVKCDKEEVEVRMSRKRAQPSMHRINKYIQTYTTNMQLDEDALCQACNSGDYEDDNLIVFCSSCNISVHQKCYGIAVVPEDDWICDVCKVFGYKRGKLLKCYLCSIRGGAMKETTTRILESTSNKPSSISQPEDLNVQESPNILYNFKQEFTLGKVTNEPHSKFHWIHLSCGYWTPELSLWLKDKTYPITGIEEIDIRRFRMTCSICKQRGVGCCTQCSKGKCSTPFHAECARLANIHMEFGSNKGELEPNSILCDKHRPSIIRRSMERSTKRSMEEITDFCRMTEKCGAIAQRCIEEGGKIKRRMVSNKLFNKIEKKKLLERIRFICRRHSKLLLNFSKQVDKGGKETYKITSIPYKLSYIDTTNKLFFPWRDVKVSSKFTPGNCYNKYLSIVQNEEEFKTKILQIKKEQLDKEEQRSLCTSFREKKRVEQDTLRYCYCRSRANDIQSVMIGIRV